MKKFGLILGVLLLIATTAFAQFGAGAVLSGLDVGPMVTYQLGPFTFEGLVSLANVSFGYPSIISITVDGEEEPLLPPDPTLVDPKHVFGAGFNVGVRCLYDVVSTKESAFYLGAGLNVPVISIRNIVLSSTSTTMTSVNLTLSALEPVVLFGAKWRVASKVTLFAEAGYALAFLLPVKVSIKATELVDGEWVEKTIPPKTATVLVDPEVAYGRTFASLGITYSF